MKKIKIEYILLAIPIFLTFIYVFFIAEKKYQSKAEFMVQKINSPSNISMPFAGLITGQVSSEKQDSYIIDSYLRSFKTFKYIEEKFKLKEYYISKKTDILERLKKDSPIEYFYSLYKKNLKFEFDENNNIVSLYFSINEPELAKNILDELLNISNEYLNDMNKENALIEKNFIETQISLNEEKLKKVEKELKDFQKTKKILDPELDIKFNQTFLTELLKEKIIKKSEFNLKEKYLNSNSPELLLLKEELKEINKNIKKIEEKFYLNKENSLNELFFEFQYLKNRLELEKTIYKETLISFELTKIDTIKQSKKIEIISNPFVAEKEIYPNKLILFLSITVLTIMLFWIFKFIQALIKEHKE